MSVVVSVRIPQELKEAEKYDIDISEVARRALEKEARRGDGRSEANRRDALQDPRRGDGRMAQRGEEGEVEQVLM